MWLLRLDRARNNILRSCNNNKSLAGLEAQETRQQFLQKLEASKNRWSKSASAAATATTTRPSRSNWSEALWKRFGLWRRRPDVGDCRSGIVFTKTYFYFIDFTDTFVLQHFRHFRCISWIGKLIKRRNFEDPTYRFTLSHASRKSKKYFQSDLLSEAAETSDDILAKYRKRPTAAAVNDEDLIDLSNSNGVILHEGNRAQVSIIWNFNWRYLKPYIHPQA